MAQGLLSLGVSDADAACSVSTTPPLPQPGPAASDHLPTVLAARAALRARVERSIRDHMLSAPPTKFQSTAQRWTVLLVEPELRLQVDVYQALRDAGANVDLTCVATCSAALSAVELTEVDAMLLSTNLCFDSAARAELPRLTSWAQGRGTPILAFTPPGFTLTNAQLCIPFHARIDHGDLTCGAFDAALECAQARARLDRGLSLLGSSARYR